MIGRDQPIVSLDVTRLKRVHCSARRFLLSTHCSHTLGAVTERVLQCCGQFRKLKLVPFFFESL